LVIIPGDQPEEGIDGYGEDVEKRKISRQEPRKPREKSTVVQDQSMTMEKSWMMIKD